METVAFFGLGQMGQGMAWRLLEGGYKLSLYNRTPEKAKTLVEKGAEFFEDPAAAVSTAKILITMLSDDYAVKAVITEEVQFVVMDDPRQELKREEAEEISG